MKNSEINYKRYLKYKKKYTQLKQFGGLGPEPESKKIVNMLIVVDVQNCFSAGGSFGGPSKNEILVNEITDLVDSGMYDYYVVTRDMHPAHHKSHMFTASKGNVFIKDNDTDNIEEVPEIDGFVKVNILNKATSLGGPWPPHCRVTHDEIKNVGSCKIRKSHDKEETLSWDHKGDELNQIGNHLSKWYNKEHPIIKHFFNPDMKLGITDEDGQQNRSPSDVSYTLRVNKIPDEIIKENRAPVLQLFKGQLCDWDAYSAFQYHANFNDGGKDIVGDLNYTTGLSEVLFSNEVGVSRFYPNVEQLNITVCGLVGDVCVKYTVSYGLNLFYQGIAKGFSGYNRINVSHDTNAYTRLTLGRIPKNIQFIYSSYATRFITSGDKTFVRNEIYNRLHEVKNKYPLPEEHQLNYTILMNDHNISDDGTPVGFTIDSIKCLL
jgi:nicotinamidase-related amidase